MHEDDEVPLDDGEGSSVSLGDFDPKEHMANSGVSISEDGKAVILKWTESGEYDITLELIHDHEAFVWWIHHLCSKSWAGMTPNRLATFIKVVSAAKGWALYERGRK